MNLPQIMVAAPASGSGNKREILIFDGMDEE